jgi:hypothetical protein
MDKSKTFASHVYMLVRAAIVWREIGGCRRRRREFDPPPEIPNVTIRHCIAVRPYTLRSSSRVRRGPHPFTSNQSVSLSSFDWVFAGPLSFRVPAGGRPGGHGPNALLGHVQPGRHVPGERGAGRERARVEHNNPRHAGGGGVAGLRRRAHVRAVGAAPQAGEPPRDPLSF